MEEYRVLKSEYWDDDINWFSPVEIGDKEFVSTSQRKITEKGLEKVLQRCFQ